MADNWVLDYLILAFRVDKSFRQITAARKYAHSYLVDYYYGPPELQQAVQGEREFEPSELVDLAAALQGSLLEEDFSPRRKNFLQKQICALETLCRKLNGEVFSLEDEVERCLDVRPYWIPETEFEQSLAILTDVLPGNGSLMERYQAWRDRYDFPMDKADLLKGIIEELIAEIKPRTAAFLDLPENDRVELATTRDKKFIAANWYLGNFTSRMEVNLDRPLKLSRFIKGMCHELYPGHHTEFSMKEKLLYRDQGYLEQSIFLLMTPQLTITEGIAMHAADMIFEPGEAEAYLVERILPRLGLSGDPQIISQVCKAEDLLDGLGCNAAFMLNAGRQDKEVIEYVMQYSLDTHEHTSHWLSTLTVPYLESYTFTYFLGKRLLEPMLRGSDRRDVFCKLLSEPVTPSDIIHSAQ